MALAILESLGSDGRGAKFRIDTGTNRYYRLKVGKAKERRAGVEWVDQVAFSTAVSANPNAGDPFRSAIEVVIPGRHFEGGHAYVQLFTFKTADGISPAFSSVELVPAGFGDGPLEFGIADAYSRSTSMNGPMTFQPPRTVPCRTGAEIYATQASIADLIGQVIKVAGPIVSNLLGGLGGGAGATASGGSGGGAAGAGGGPADMIAKLLQTILGALQPAAPPAQPPSQQKSLSMAASNRFTDGQLARPFIFGIDDALIATLAGPVLQVLPQLMNAVNQNRLQMKQQQNNLITNLVSGVNQRLMMDKLAEAQKSGQGTPDLAKLLEMLQQAQAAQPAADAATPPASTTQSLNQSWSRPLTQTSARAVLSFVTAPPVTWNGQPTLVFSKAQPMQLKLRLAVTGPAPTRPLPRAIVSIVFKDPSTQTVWLEKPSRYTNVSANDVLPASFTQDELARLPINKPIAVIAEMRWPAKGGGPARSALGSIDIVLVDRVFLKSEGVVTSEERELTDMQRFRPFWNKVWEAPTLGGSPGDEGRKTRWALNVTAKYTIAPRAEHDANGLMETRVLQGESDPDSLAMTVQGRMKAGMELSLAELNKLLPLWDNRPPLEAAQLQAVATQPFAARHTGEFVQSITLKGRAGERGMVWVVPVFQLMSLTLGNASRTDDAGQVVEAADETVAFPVPTAARIIGLKSE